MTKREELVKAVKESKVAYFAASDKTEYTWDIYYSALATLIAYDKETHVTTREELVKATKDAWRAYDISDEDDSVWNDEYFVWAAADAALRAYDKENT